MNLRLPDLAGCPSPLQKMGSGLGIRSRKWKKMGSGLGIILKKE
jgi:hypothetical protein